MRNFISALFILISVACVLGLAERKLGDNKPYNLNQTEEINYGN